MINNNNNNAEVIYWRLHRSYVSLSRCTRQGLLILNLDTEFEVISLRKPLPVKARMKSLSYFGPARIWTRPSSDCSFIMTKSSPTL